MRRLRKIHLYIGCTFAPLLIFFATSGIWQTLGWENKVLCLLGTLHQSQAMENGESLSSPVLQGIVVAMAGAFIFTMVLGIIMAFRFGHKKVATLCLFIGFAVPVALAIVNYITNLPA